MIFVRLYVRFTANLKPYLINIATLLNLVDYINSYQLMVDGMTC